MVAGKDKVLKYWDGDKFELLLQLAAHQGPLNCVAVVGRGHQVVTGGADRHVAALELFGSVMCCSTENGVGRVVRDVRYTCNYSVVAVWESRFVDGLFLGVVRGMV